MVIVTLAAVSMSPRTSSVTAPAELLHASSDPVPGAGTGGAGGGGSPDGVHGALDPHDFDAFKEGMDTFLRSIKIDPAQVDFEPPKEYRTSDTRPGQTPCNAYKIMNQGMCGSCYAFAADTSFSARMCHACSVPARDN